MAEIVPERIVPAVGSITGPIRDGFDLIRRGRVDYEQGDTSRLLMQVGMVLGTVYVAFLTVWFWATRLRWNGGWRAGARRALGQREDESDASPDENEASQHPEQECRLADRQPRDVRAIEEEARAPEPAVIVVLGDLAGDRLRGVLGRPAGGVGVYDLAGSASGLRLGCHRPSVATRERVT